jgi:hypothetical protein
LTRYRHTQRGTLVLWLLGFVMVIVLIVSAASGVSGPVAVMLAVVLLVLILCAVWFGSLTVEIDESLVRVRFGPGPIGKSFPLAEIRSTRIVRNPWYYGWGIRLIPHGWLFNVSGSHAVELEMKGGRKFRVGTDEPEALHAALVSALATSGGGAA